MLKFVLFSMIVMAALVSADPVPWTNCGTDADLIEINTFDLTPWPPQLGANITGTVDLNVKQTLVNGTYTALVKVDGIKVYSGSGDLADILAYADLSFPIPAGDVSETLTVPIPALPISGNVDATISAVMGNDELLCMEVKFKPVQPSKVRDTPALCEDLSSESDCTGATEQDGDACYWCECSAVPSSCFNSTVAKSLPKSIFDCKGLPSKNLLTKF